MGVTLRLRLAFHMEFPVINIALVILCLLRINTLHHTHWLRNV